MKRKIRRLKEMLDLVTVVLFPSAIVGITVALGIFAIRDIDITVETAQRFFTVATISSLVAAIYFSIKCTIWVLEEKQNKAKSKRKQTQIVSLENNSKLYRGARAVS